MPEEIEPNDEVDKAESSDNESEERERKQRKKRRKRKKRKREGKRREEEAERLRGRVRNLESEASTQSRGSAWSGCFPLLVLAFAGMAAFLRFSQHKSWGESLILSSFMALGVVILAFCVWMWGKHHEVVIGIGVLLLAVLTIGSCLKAIF